LYANDDQSAAASAAAAADIVGVVTGGRSDTIGCSLPAKFAGRCNARIHWLVEFATEATTLSQTIA